MKIINNKKGSAILWCILLTVIMTILLASIMGAAYAYFNYTIYTVKRQQAYFTARSATNILLDRLSSEAQTMDESYNYNENIDVLPPQPSKAQKENSLTIDSIGLDESMGTATATITRNYDGEVLVDVTAYYPDKENGEKYEIKAKVMRQSLNFSGVALKKLTLGRGSTFSLGRNTDLYWYGEGDDETFDLSKIATKNNAKFNIEGNLVTLHNAVIDTNCEVAGYRFNEKTTFDNTAANPSRKIWNKEQYILSNTEIEIDEDQGIYSTSFVNAVEKLDDVTFHYCNNNQRHAYGGQYGILIKRTVQPTFGTTFGGSSIASDIKDALDEALADIGLAEVTNIFTDVRNQGLAITDTASDAMDIKYIQILSLNNSVNKSLNYLKSKGFNSVLINYAKEKIDEAFEDLYFNVCDISYIEFKSNNMSTWGDNVAPQVYLFVEGTGSADASSGKGITVRVKYGSDPGSQSNLFGTFDNISDALENLASDWFGITNKISYVTVYLGEYATLDLGTKVGNRLSNAQQNGNLVFFYSVYGATGSKLVLHDGVTLVGEARVDEILVDDNANVKIIYASNNGSQVAKQKIAEFWTVVDYREG